METNQRALTSEIKKLIDEKFNQFKEDLFLKMREIKLMELKKLKNILASHNNIITLKKLDRKLEDKL